VQLNDNDNVLVRKLEHIIRTWNQDPAVNGILVQLLLPDRLRQYHNGLIKLISPEKDVDGLLYPNTSFIPCAAEGIIWLLDWYDVKLTGKNVVVVGSSKLVGKCYSTIESHLLRKHL
jgi:methylenetetrahydrofolate dehydrogenase (NADP+)/methenyltetrahydrofolate cyclohydrolase